MPNDMDKNKLPDILQSNQLFEARLKANDFAQEHLKQIITVSSATLVLTVTFVKEIMGIGTPAYPYLLQISWILLACSILLGILSLALLVNNLEVADETITPGKKYPRAFAASALSAVRVAASLSIGFFGLGMLSLALFGAANFRERFSSYGLVRSLLSETAVIEIAKKNVPSGKSFMYLKSIELVKDAPTLPTALLSYKIGLAVKSTDGKTEILQYSIDAFSGAISASP
jgi:ABC-type multidrug transport system fused ATPase/permease subunit